MRCHAASKHCSTILGADQFNEIRFSAVPVLGLLYAAETDTAISCSIGGYLPVATVNHPRRLELYRHLLENVKSWILKEKHRQPIFL